eukprot:PhM_4_TR15975/c0_g1_i1/m.97973
MRRFYFASQHQTILSNLATATTTATHRRGTTALLLSSPNTRTSTTSTANTASALLLSAASVRPIASAENAAWGFPPTLSDGQCLQQLLHPVVVVLCVHCRHVLAQRVRAAEIRSMSESSLDALLTVHPTALLRIPYKNVVSNVELLVGGGGGGELIALLQRMFSEYVAEQSSAYRVCRELKIGSASVWGAYAHYLVSRHILGASPQLVLDGIRGAAEGRICLGSAPPRWRGSCAKKIWSVARMVVAACEDFGDLTLGIEVVTYARETCGIVQRDVLESLSATLPRTQRRYVDWSMRRAVFGRLQMLLSMTHPSRRAAKMLTS